MNRIFTAAFIIILQQPDWVAAHANIISWSGHRSGIKIKAGQKNGNGCGNQS